MRYSEKNRCKATKGELRCELHRLHVERLPDTPEAHQHEAVGADQVEVKWRDD